jgi:hypothetical protein
MIDIQIKNAIRGWKEDLLQKDEVYTLLKSVFSDYYINFYINKDFKYISSELTDEESLFIIFDINGYHINLEYFFDQDTPEPIESMLIVLNNENEIIESFGGTIREVINKLELITQYI